MKDIQTYNEPAFDNKTGYLISGIYLMKIDDLLNHEILGGTAKRKNLIYSLKEACEIYWSYGIYEIYVNGSFATIKEYPNDIDGYLRVDVKSESFIKLTSSGNIWGQLQSIGTYKLPMWHKYKIEFYVENKYEQFHNFFTHSKDGIERGIIKLIKGGQND
ncbi:MAG: hypothetical protein WCY19_00610 [Candidatus Gastranaerophilaceae bacterium]